MAYAFVGQHTLAASSNVTTLAPTAWTAVVGNHFTVVMQGSLAAAGALTPSDGVNTYVLVGNYTGTNFCYAWYEANNVAGVSTTVTGTASAGFIRGILVREDSGLANPAYVTGSFTGHSVSSPGTGTNAITTSSINITTAPSALMGVGVNESGPGGGGPTAGTGFSGRSSAWGGGAYAAETPEDQRITVASNVPVTFTAVSGTGTDVYSVMGALFAETGAIVGQAVPPGGPARIQWHYRSA